MKKRWIVYIIIGIVFGIFDFFYQEVTVGALKNWHLLLFIIDWAVWLVPAIPIVIYETKISNSRKAAVFSNVLVWSLAIISYSLYMIFKLVFIGQTSMKFLYISNYRDKFYISNVKSFFVGSVWTEIYSWLPVAIIGGAVTGFLINYLYLRIRKQRI